MRLASCLIAGVLLLFATPRALAQDVDDSRAQLPPTLTSDFVLDVLAQALPALRAEIDRVRRLRPPQEFAQCLVAHTLDTAVRRVVEEIRAQRPVSIPLRSTRAILDAAHRRALLDALARAGVDPRPLPNSEAPWTLPPTVATLTQVLQSSLVWGSPAGVERTLRAAANVLTSAPARVEVRWTRSLRSRLAAQRRYASRGWRCG